MNRLRGVIAAAATPLTRELAIDGDALVAHCRWLLDRGCDGINLLGTTGEATSFPLQARLDAMERVARSGLPLHRFMVGTGAAALDDAVRLTAAARDLGFAGALLLPPFYYKGIDDEGLVAFVETLIGRVGSADLRLYLYHFPQNSGVPYPVEVVRRLKAAHPGTLFGVKDSSGDLRYAAELARTPDLDVFPSAEGSLSEARNLGFAGCISATANVTAPFAAEGWRLGDGAGAEAIAKAVALRGALGRLSLLASVKWALGEIGGAAALWARLVPPLRPLSGAEADQLRGALAETAFADLRSGAAAA